MIGLRYCAGEAFCSLVEIYGPNKRHIKSYINTFLDAVDFYMDIMLTCDLLPRSPAKIKKSANDWVKKSCLFLLFNRTVGAIDGMLQTT